MDYIGDYAVDSTVNIYFETVDTNFGGVAPTGPFDAADVKVYQNGVATPRASEDGYTMISPFNAIVGLHFISIDTSDYGDPGFWDAGNDYTVVLSPDTETVNGVTPVKVLGQFSLENRPVFLANGTHGGVAATITAKGITVVATDADTSAVSFTGLGTGSGMACLGGVTSGNGLLALGQGTGAAIAAIAAGSGHGIQADGASGGDGIKATGIGTSANGINAVGASGGHGIVATGEGVGSGLRTNGGTTGDGITAQGQGTGNGISAQGGVTGGTDAQSNGILASSGAASDAHGIYCQGDLTGDGIKTVGGATSGNGLYALGQGMGDGIGCVGGQALGTPGDGLNCYSPGASDGSAGGAGFVAIADHGIGAVIRLANTSALDEGTAALWISTLDAGSTTDAIVVTNAGSGSATFPAIEGAIKKNTAFSNFEFLMVDSTDHITPKTGLTVTGERSIDGGAFAVVDAGSSFAEISDGIYSFDAVAADTNGDLITWKFSGTAADDAFFTFKTVQA